LKNALAEIIRGAQNGDLEAFRQVHEAYAHRILNFINRMVDSREDAEDLTQNAFLSAFHELTKLQEVEKFESWLYRIARNEVYQYFRRKRIEPKGYEPANEGQDDIQLSLNLTDGRPSPQEQILHKELGATIRKLLVSLPPKLREVFILAVVEEKSYAEISDIVGRSILSVKTDIFRARGQARRYLGSYLEVKK
jgi:RNA polymerase sigma-70 factor, ECF subfamily